MTDKAQNETKDGYAVDLQRCVMRRSMVFIGEDGSFMPKDEQRLCAHLGCKTTIGEPITHYPSRQHAIDAGWRYVERGPFCNKGNYGVWVCPTCAEKIGA